MKKLWIVILAVLCTNLYAQKKITNPMKMYRFKPVETILNIEDDPLTIDSDKPSFPPLDFVNEVENSEGVKLLKNLKKLKKRKEDLVKRIAIKKKMKVNYLEELMNLKIPKNYLKRILNQQEY